MANAQAWESGWQLGADAIAARRARKQALNDQEFQMHATRLGDLIDSNRKMLSTIDPQKSPSEYASKVNDLRQNLQEIRELYHPNHREDAVAKFGHLITDKLGMTDPQKRIHKVAQQRADVSASDEREAQALAQATPNLSPEQEQQTTQRQDEASRQWQLDWAQRHGIAGTALTELTEHLAGLPVAKAMKPLPGSKPYKGPDGLYYQSMQDATGQIVAEAMPEGYTPPPSGAVIAWKKDQQGRIVSILLDKQTKTPIPGTENYDLLPPSYLTPRISQGTYHFVDEDNNIHALPETRISGPAFGGGTATPGAGARATIQAGGAAARATPAAAGDHVIGVKGSAALNKAKSAYADAVRVASLADDVAENSNSEKDALFVLALIRSEAGRVNQAEIGQLFNAGGITEAPERWAAKYGHGELPQTLRLQLQDFAHAQIEAAQAAVDALRSSKTPPKPKAGVEDTSDDDDFLKKVPKVQ